MMMTPIGIPGVSSFQFLKDETSLSFWPNCSMLSCGKAPWQQVTLLAQKHTRKQDDNVGMTIAYTYVIASNGRTPHGTVKERMSKPEMKC